MKTKSSRLRFCVPRFPVPSGALRGLLYLLMPLVAANWLRLNAEPLLDSWFTTYSGKYARLYETDADLAAGNAVSTWSRGAVNQSLPAYCGVDEVFYSVDWVYIRTTGLGSHVMGPWYLGSARTQLFPNLPGNTATLYRIPRHPVIPANKTLTDLGVIGYFVDGVAMFDGRDAFYWGGSGDVQAGAGGGVWNRDAYVNERATFDPANAHQEQTGTYHYHANPMALRYLLGDHVAYDSATKTYRENPVELHHSPIVGWVRDGFPIYGPYGYSDPLNTNSAIRRMISGFVPRDGTRGTTDLAATGRTSLPTWAARAQGRSATLAPSDYGPNVSAPYPLGRYLEDNEYRGDLGETQGAAFDLDEYNGRYCRTPDFPEGTYAYFVSVASNGAPVFPYNIGRSFYGSPTGDRVTAVAENVTTNFIGGAESALRLEEPVMASNSGTVTLVWSSVEGGTYQVDSSAAFPNWTRQAANIQSQGVTTQISLNADAQNGFYRVARTALADYDGGGGASNTALSPNAAARGATVTVTITLDANAQPAPPPQNAPVNQFSIGAINGTALQHLSQTQVRGTFAIPVNASTGTQTVTVVFPGPPDNPGQTVTYTFNDAFVIH